MQVEKLKIWLAYLLVSWVKGILTLQLLCGRVLCHG